MSDFGVRFIATKGPVLIIGTGLLGTSIGLALRTAGVEVLLSDISPISQQLAQDMGAGVSLEAAREVFASGMRASGAGSLCGNGDCSDASGTGFSQRVRLVIVAAPPDVAGRCVVDALRAFPNAVVTDVASVKAPVADVVRKWAGEQAAALVDEGNTNAQQTSMSERYVGSHPMSGRERSGAGAADADLFIGNPWVIVPSDESSANAVLAVRTLAVDVGAMPVEMEAETHDQAVALVSHVPQLMSSLLAARLAEAPSQMLSLSGKGLRDTTRVAGSDPRLWTAILAANAQPVNAILREVRADIDDLIEHFDATAEQGSLQGGCVGTVNRVIEAGNRGVARIPGKHGGTPQKFAEIDVLVPDKPGELARLFGDLGDLDINIEDLTLEHSAGQKVGLARISVNPTRARDGEVGLERRGWRLITQGADH